MFMTKRFAILLVALVVVLIAVVAWGALDAKSKGKGQSGYTAVFLVSGDIYFGNLSWFPWPKLANVWFVQRGVDEQNRPQLAIVPFASAFWGPAGDVYLNPKQVLFWAPVSASSQIARTIDGANTAGQLPPQQSQTPPPPAEVAK